MIGYFAMSKAGHDKKECYMVIAETEEYVLLCNGRNKTIEHPKKKNKKHIQIIYTIADEDLFTALCNGKKVTDEQINIALRKYQK